MKNTPISLAIFFLLLSTTPAISQEHAAGESIFTVKKCQRCHASGNEKKKGPSLEVIAEIYQTEEKLLSYFKGEGEPIVEPARAKLMKMRRRQIKKLSSQQQNDLGKYMMSFKK